jgi:hypothetical protein
MVAQLLLHSNSVMDEYVNSFASLHPSKYKAQPKGSVELVTSPIPKGKQFPKQFKKRCSLFANQGHKSENCYLHPENVHKNLGIKVNEMALTTTAPCPAISSITWPYCQKTENTEMQERDSGRKIFWSVCCHFYSHRKWQWPQTHNYQQHFHYWFRTYLSHAWFSGGHV